MIKNSPPDKWLDFPYSRMCAHLTLCCAESLSCVWLFVTQWSAAHQAPLFMGILQAGVLEWVAMLSSRSSQLRDWTHVLHIRVVPRWRRNRTWRPCIAYYRQILNSLSQQGSPWIVERVAYHFSRGHFTLSCKGNLWWPLDSTVHKYSMNTSNYNRLNYEKDMWGRASCYITYSCQSMTPWIMQMTLP